MSDRAVSKVSNRLIGQEPRHMVHVAVVMGGMSSERDVSLSSGEGIVRGLCQAGYDVTPIDMGYDIAQILAGIKPDIVFNALHGTYGEDGCLPGLLMILGIPFTHSGVMASAIGFDKSLARRVFTSGDIPVAPAIEIDRTHWDVEQEPMPRPYVIKPISQGSSVGVHLVFPGDNFCLRDYDWMYGDRVLVERYIPGREIQVAVLGDRALGAIEICAHNRFYDYEAKYTDGRATHVMPAPVDEKTYQRLMDYALKAHQLLGCLSVSRSDFRVDDTVKNRDPEIYLLEINTHPGMTPLSLVPEIAAYYDIAFPQLLHEIVQAGLCAR
jgi:D-alanine-D-alanine ligase